MSDEGPDRGIANIWSALRRRKVVQWGLAYVAGAWALLQGIDFLVDAFHWPDAAKQIATIALAIGLPVALVLAWYHGDRGQQRVGGTELTILAAVLALGGFLLWRYEPATETPATATATATTPAPARDPPNSKSIAVLPFADMSPEKDQEYMSDGIAEELLNLLAQVPDLKVIARTSSFAFKGEKVEIEEIAKRLNVAHVLEGSVRKSGNTVRITAQLIDARSDTHLWSETYDRPLDNIFAVQDEIAAAVVAQLKLKLLGAAPKAKAVDPKAYALYLQARQIGRQRTPEAIERSNALYQQALAIDANDAAAWEGLASDYFYQTIMGLRPIEEGYRLVREAVDKALAIDPDFAPAHGLLGRIAMNYDGDLAAAARHFEHALALESSNPDIIRNASVLAASLGRLDTAITLGEYVVARDPVNAVGHSNLSITYSYAGRQDEAIESCRTALSLSPSYGHAQYQIGVALLLKGDPAGALATMQKESSGLWRMVGLPMAWHALGTKGQSDAALAELIEKGEKDAAYNIAYVLAFRGETDRAFEWLDKAVAYHDGGLAYVAVEPLFTNLHHDPRWLPFLRKIGKAPEQLAAIKFDVKVLK